MPAVVAKGKERKRQREHDAELLDKHSAKVKVKTRPAEFQQLSVSGSEVRAVMDETVWRVLREISPDLPDDSFQRMNSDELSYIIRLHMVVGSDAYSPRASMKIKETPMGDPPLCHEHR